MSKSKSKSKIQAEQFLSAAQDLGIFVAVHNDLVELCASFTPGDRAAFARLDSQAELLMAELPGTRAGSTWGTQGHTVGGHAALVNGVYCLKRSGVSRRILAALAACRL